MSNKISDLNLFVAGLCRRLISLCKEEGITLRVTSTLRTAKEQLALFAQGRNSLKYVNELRAGQGLPPITESENKIVTHSLTSIHQFGYAFDVVVIKDGVPSWKPSDYERVGEIAESLGLQWGGRWRLKDYCHFQYTGGLTIADLKAGKRPEFKDSIQIAGVRG